MLTTCIKPITIKNIFLIGSQCTAQLYNIYFVFVSTTLLCLGAAVVPHLPPWETDNFPQDLVCIGIVGIKDPLRDEVRITNLLYPI